MYLQGPVACQSPALIEEELHEMTIDLFFGHGRGPIDVVYITLTMVPELLEGLTLESGCPDMAFGYLWLAAKAHTKWPLDFS